MLVNAGTPPSTTLVNIKPASGEICLINVKLKKRGPQIWTILEQRMLLQGKRIFTHPSICTFNNVMNVIGTKLRELSNLIQIIIKNKNV